MDWPDPIGGIARELALFASIGFLLGGLDDLLVDLIWIARTLWRRATIYSRHLRADAGTLAPPREPGRLAIFVAAWQEEAVIGGMVATALASLRHPDWRLYVGCYPNDPATIATVGRGAAGDPHVRIVIGEAPGRPPRPDASTRSGVRCSTTNVPRIARSRRSSSMTRRTSSTTTSWRCTTR